MKTKAQHTFEKLAIDFGTTRKLLQRLRANNVKITREGGTFSSQFVPKQAVGGVSQDTINVGRGSKTLGARNLLLHEAGHWKDKKLLPRIQQLENGPLDIKKGSAGRKTSATDFLPSSKAVQFTSETAADRNALDLIKELSAKKKTTQNLQHYKKERSGAARTYITNSSIKDMDDLAPEELAIGTKAFQQSFLPSFKPDKIDKLMYQNANLRATNPKTKRKFKVLEDFYSKRSGLDQVPPERVFNLPGKVKQERIFYMPGKIKE